MVASLMVNTQKLPFYSSEEIMNFIHEEVEKLVRNLLEILMFEERKIYLEEQEDSGNEFYTRKNKGLERKTAFRGVFCDNFRRKLFCY